MILTAGTITAKAQAEAAHLQDTLAKDPDQGRNQGTEKVDMRTLARAGQLRGSKWTKSVAVGSRDVVETLKAELDVRAKGRRTGRRIQPPRAPGLPYSDDFNA